MHIVVQGKTVHEAVELLLRVVMGRLKDAPRPLVIVHVGAAADLADRMILVIVSHIGLVTAVQIAVVGRAHVAAAAPVFISHAEIIDLPGLLMAVLPALLRHRGNALERHVLDPLGHLAHRAAADIAVDVGLAAQLAAELKILVRPEAVVLHDAAPVGVDHLLAVLLRTDAVLPVILVGEAAARPAQHRNLELLQRLNDVRPHAVHVRDVGVLPDIESLIDASAQVLGEMSVNLRVDVGNFLLIIDYKLCHTSSFRLMRPGI